MPTFNTLIRELGKELGGYFEGTSTAAAASTITDTSTDGLQSSFLSNDKLRGYWLKITDGAAIGDVRIVTYVASTGVLTADLAFSAIPTAASAYELYGFDVPALTTGLGLYINLALRDLKYPTVYFPTLVPDGDMDANNTTNWATTSNATVAKTTMAANVFTGQRALTVTNSAANGYVQTDSMPCKAGDVFYVEATCKPRTSNDDANLQVWDVTNAAQITVSADYNRPTWGVLHSRFVTAPTGCENIALRLRGVGANDIVDWDNCIVVGANQKTFLMPTSYAFEQEVWIERMAVMDDAGSSNTRALDRYAPMRLRAWNVDASFTAANPFYVRVSEDGMGKPLAVHYKRVFDALVLGADTTPIPEEFVVAAAMVEAYKIRAAVDAPNAKLWLPLMNQAMLRFNELAALYSPDVPSGRMPRER